jgi:hypothetical protein
MPDHRVQSTDHFLGDIWRETSWPVRLGLFTVIAVGFIGGFVIDGNLMLDVGVGFSMTRVSFTSLVLIMFACLFAGGFVGLFFGVIADFIVSAIRGPQHKKEKKRRRP